MNQSAGIKELAAALAKAQAEIKGAVKDSANPFFKSSYADLQSVWDACRAPLTKNGLSVAQTTDIFNDKPVLVTTLMHSSGEWLRGTLPISPVKNDPQALGSAITYARRYALASMVGVYQTDDIGDDGDDDGNAASGRNAPAITAKSIQPGPNDGIQKPEGTYRIPRHMDSRLAGKHPEDCDPVALREAIEAIEKKYSGKTMPPGAVTFIKECEPFVAAWENQKVEEEAMA